MANSKQQRVEKNLLYIREQLSRFLYKKYKLKLDYKLYGNKELKKERRYSKITFPSNKSDTVEIDVDYETVLKGNRQKLMDIAFRNAIRLGQWQTGKPYKEGHPVLDELMKKNGLKVYGQVCEMGMDLHTYQCSSCKKIYMLQVKKLPPSKNPVERGYVTNCCKQPFEYTGVNYYDNEELQKIYGHLNTRGHSKTIAKRQETSAKKESGFSF